MAVFVERTSGEALCLLPLQPKRHSEKKNRVAGWLSKQESKGGCFPGCDWQSRRFGIDQKESQGCLGGFVASDKREQDQWTMLLADGRCTLGNRIEVFLASCFTEVSVKSFGVC